MRRNTLPVVFSSVLKRCFNCFTRPCQEHLIGYVLGLILMVRFRSVRRIAQHVGGGTVDAMHYFVHDAVWRAESLISAVQTPVVEVLRQTRERTLLILDDTPIERRGRHIEGSGIHHGPNGLVAGLCAVTAVVRFGTTSFFWNILGYRPKANCPRGEFRSKIDLADAVLADAARIRMPLTVVMDSWYACARLLNRSHGYGWTFVTALKKNRLVCLEDGRKTRVANLAKGPHQYVRVRLNTQRTIRASQRLVQLPKFGVVKLVIGRSGDEKRYIVTNDLEMPVEEVVRLYAERCWIDTLHRDVKQHLGLGEMYGRSWQAAQRHWALVLTAYNTLILWNRALPRSERGRTVGEVVRLFRNRFGECHGIGPLEIKLRLAA